MSWVTYDIFDLRHISHSHKVSWCLTSVYWIALQSLVTYHTGPWSRILQVLGHTGPWSRILQVLGHVSYRSLVTYHTSSKHVSLSLCVTQCVSTRHSWSSVHLCVECVSLSVCFCLCELSNGDSHSGFIARSVIEQSRKALAVCEAEHHLAAARSSRDPLAIQEAISRGRRCSIAETVAESIIRHTLYLLHNTLTVALTQNKYASKFSHSVLLSISA